MDTYGAFVFVARQVDINNGNQLFRLIIAIFLIINNLKERNLFRFNMSVYRLIIFLSRMTNKLRGAQYIVYISYFCQKNVI